MSNNMYYFSRRRYAIYVSIIQIKGAPSLHFGKSWNNRCIFRPNIKPNTPFN